MGWGVESGPAIWRVACQIAACGCAVRLGIAIRGCNPRFGVHVWNSGWRQCDSGWGPLIGGDFAMRFVREEDIARSEKSLKGQIVL